MPQVRIQAYKKATAEMQVGGVVRRGRAGLTAALAGTAA